MKCKYESCSNTRFKDNNFCILHMELPSNPDSPEFSRVNDIKNKCIKEKIKRGDLNFKGVKLASVDLSDLSTPHDLIFTGAYLKGNLELKDSSIKGDVWFDKATIHGDLSLERSKIDGSASFYGTKFKKHVWFDNARIRGYTWFEKTKIEGEASFNGVDLRNSLSFKNAEIDGNTSFYGAKIDGDAWFDDSQINGDVWFNFIEIKGGLSFLNTDFKIVKSQEKACRKAKTVWEKLGDRSKADYHFYREMEAKRKQKPLHLQYLEIIVQYPFGYGVFPGRLLFSFGAVMFLFAIFYWILEGSFTAEALSEKIRFSFLTIIIPAYGVINAKTGLYGLLTILEALVGAFTWPTFIVTFARKYMR